MNSRYLISMLVMLAVTTAAFAQQEMTVHLKGGQQITYDINEINYVELKAHTATSDSPAAEEVGGVVGNAVDLGLSVQWADINLGAEQPTDDGVRLSWSDASSLASKWGNGWRLPTAEEWQELYNNCKWKWEVRDGVGGRLITANNGNSIFVPATGVSFDGNIQIRGCIGIYWTNAVGEEAEGVPSSAMGTYFDSANIYRIAYPRTNTFSVRLVK